MLLSELEKTLHNSGLPKDAYSLSGGLPNEAYCLEQAGDGRWRTYYSERGQRTALKVFDTEEAACEFFLKWVTR